MDDKILIEYNAQYNLINKINSTEVLTDNCKWIGTCFKLINEIYN